MRVSTSHPDPESVRSYTSIHHLAFLWLVPLIPTFIPASLSIAIFWLTDFENWLTQLLIIYQSTCEHATPLCVFLTDSFRDLSISVPFWKVQPLAHRHDVTMDVTAGQGLFSGSVRLVHDFRCDGDWTSCKNGMMYSRYKIKTITQCVTSHKSIFSCCTGSGNRAGWKLSPGPGSTPWSQTQDSGESSFALELWRNFALVQEVQ